MKTPSLLSGIEIFVCAVEAGSFTAAAKRIGLTPSAVSKSITRLEAQVGVRLLNRTTRTVQPTFDGDAFYQRCARAIAEIEQAEAEMARSRGAPRGRVRVDAPVTIGRMIIAPALPGLLAKHPELGVDLSMHDHYVNVTAEGVDVAVRMREPKDLDLVARRLGSARVVVCGAPSYFKAHGRPRRPDDLAQHRCLGYLVHGRPRRWRFRDDASAGDGIVSVTGPMHCDMGEALRGAAVAGLGMVQLFEFIVASELASGALETVLDEFAVPDRPIYAMYQQGRQIAPKVRVMVEFLAGLFK